MAEAADAIYRLRMYTVVSRQLGFTKPLGQSTPSGRSMLGWRRRLVRSALAERKAQWSCFLVGWLIQLIVSALFVALARVAIKAREPLAHSSAWRLGGVSAIIVCGIALIIAWFTKPEGRTERARQCWENGIDSLTQPDPSSPIGLAVLLLLIASLYGAYAIVESIRRSRLCHAIAHVDRMHAARVMDDICCSPAGVYPIDLLTCGENRDSLRGILSLLLFEGWIDLQDGRVVQRGRTMREITHQHPLVDIFASME